MAVERLGLVVNPVAGLGGRVGLKGTDRPAEALARGALPVAPQRAVRFLRALRGEPTLYTAGGAMGEEACEAAGLSAIVVHAPADPSTPQDTREAAAALAGAGVDLLVFVGGDGTAADVLAGLRAADAAKLPCLGVPSGVKMYGAVFAETPERAAVVVDSFDHLGTGDVLDIDEAAFRRGELRVQLKGQLRVPTHRAVQAGKLAGEDDEVEQASLAEAAAERVGEGETWILGAGGTLLEVKRALGIPGTLLGVDVVRREAGQIEPVVLDATEKDLLKLESPRLMLSPIGAQGFILGRGNLVISAEVVRRAGAANVLVVATPTKLASTPALHVDTGEAALDGSFPRFLRVLTGHHATRLVRLE